MFDRAVKELKKFNWDNIITKACSLSDFNDAQWRFMKALIIELCIEKHSNGNLKYVGANHKDYDWLKLKMSVELKSNTSCTMFGKRGKLRKKYTIMLNNSMGTNTKVTLDKSEISDIIIAVFADGVFAIDKGTAIDHLIMKGDGFSIVIPSDKITLVYKNPDVIKDTSIASLKNDIMNLIRSKI